MPLAGPASFLPTTDEFLAHWASANTEMGARGPIVVLKDKARATLLGLRTQLETVRAAIESLRNGREEARFVIESTKAGLLARLNQFNLKIRSLSPDSKWETMLPKAFTVSEGMGKVIPPLDELHDLWQRYEAEEDVVLLRDDYTLAACGADLAALKVAYTALISADNALGLKRGERTELENKIQPILKAYRQRIPAEFAEGSAIMATLPRLSPVPGQVPEPVEVSGSFNVTTQTADLHWTASTQSTLAAYQVRGVAGPVYEEEDEVLLATVLPGAPRVFATNFALGTPGNTASYRVYTVSDAGNEKPSNAVAVTRPV